MTPAPLSLSDDQRALCDALARVLSQEAGSAAARRAMERPDALDDSLLATLQAQGVFSLLIPEAHGGLGLGLMDACLVAEPLAQAMACVPWMESAVQATLLLRELAGLCAAQSSSPAHGLQVDGPALELALTRLVEGHLLMGMIGANLGPAWRHPSQHPAKVSGSSLHCDASGTVTPTAGEQPWMARQPGAAAVQDLLVLAQAKDGVPALVSLERTQWESHSTVRASWDPTRPFLEITLAQGERLEGRCLAQGPDLLHVIERARALAAIVAAAEQVGLASQALQLSLDHLAQREQFGRTLAHFQALKHRCAEMLVQIELARSAVWGSAAQADAHCSSGTTLHNDLLHHAAVAVHHADQAARWCTQEAIQLHGGAGYTWEYDPHLLFKRAQGNRAGAADPQAWLSAWEGVAA